MKTKQLWSPPSRRSRRLWALVLVGLFAVTGAALLLISRAATGVTPGLSSSTASTVNRGQTISFQIKFKNNDDRQSIDYHIDAIKPSYTSFSSNPGYFTNNPPTWNGSLSPGATFTTTFNLVVSNSAPCSQLLKTRYSYWYNKPNSATTSGYSAYVSHRAVDRCAKINSFSAPNSAYTNQNITLSWRTTNVSRCTASGSWSGSKAADGSQTISGPSSPQTRSYKLSCPSKYSGYSSASRTISVRYTSRPASAAPPPPPSTVTPVAPPSTSTSASVSRPSAPRSFKVRASSIAGLALSWQAPTDKGSGLKYYILQRSSTTEKWQTIKTKITTRSYRDTSAKADTSYYYRLFAVDKKGHRSPETRTRYAALADKPVSFTDTLTSADGLLTITFNDQTFREDTSCNLEPPAEVAEFSVLSKPILVGPYSLICLGDDGQPVEFHQPAQLTLSLDADPATAAQKSQTYSDLEIVYADSNGQLNYLTPQFDPSTGQTTAEATNLNSLVLVGTPGDAALVDEAGGGSDWFGTLLLIILIGIAGGGGWFFFKWRTRQQALNEYAELYNQYKTYGHPPQSAPPVPTEQPIPPVQSPLTEPYPPTPPEGPGPSPAPYSPDQSPPLAQPPEAPQAPPEEPPTQAPPNIG